MSAGTRTTIGFDRTIHVEWLDAAAARVAAGHSVDETRAFLWKFLENEVPGNTNSSGRGKTLTVLTRIWVDVPSHANALREAALKCVSSATGEERVAIHWAMAIGTHSFFFDVATHAGKLFALHGHANRTQIKRRMTDTWGDRSTLERTIQHVLRSMSQWGLLQAGPERGSLVPLPKRLPLDSSLSELLAHAVLLSSQRALPLAQLTTHPALFPFEIHTTLAALRKSTTLRVERQGDQTDIVELVARGPIAA